MQIKIYYIRLTESVTLLRLVGLNLNWIGQNLQEKLILGIKATFRSTVFPYVAGVLQFLMKSILFLHLD